MIVADFGYGQDRNPAMQRAFGGKFWKCLYPGGEQNANRRADGAPKWNVKDRVVQVDRSAGLKIWAERLRAGGLRLPVLPGEVMGLLTQHFTALTIVQRTDDETRETWDEVVNTGPDHFAHACHYAILAADRYAHGGVRSGAVVVGRSPFRGVVTPGAVVRPPWSMS